MINIDDIKAAAQRLAGKAIRTPLLRSDELNRRTGARIYLKAEPLQRTGSFKFRGAFNAISQSHAESVVAFSSGNHAQGVACAAQLLGKQATIVMPADAPAMKIDNTRGFGAELILADRYRQDREALAHEIAHKKHAEVIPPFDDLRVMAGQGTAGLEIAEDLSTLGVTPDLALICTGGGGLMSGCAVALRHHFPDLVLHTVEPQGYDDWRISLEAGEPRPHGSTTRSICDALLSAKPGNLTFPTARTHLGKGLWVSDDEALQAVRFAANHLKIVVEPGGAVALAAALEGEFDIAGKTVVVMLSGGNIDPDMLSSAMLG